MNLRSRRIEMLAGTILSEETVSSIRHDLRNKLANVRNAAFYIRRRIEQGQSLEDPRVGTFLKLIDDELNAAAQILNSRLASPPKEQCLPVDLAACVGDALRLTKLPPTVTVDNQLQPLASIHGTQDAVTLLIRCLLDSGVEAMPDGGQVMLCTTDATECVVLSIADTRRIKPSDRELDLVRLIATHCSARVIAVPVLLGARVDVVLPKAKPVDICNVTQKVPHAEPT